LLLVALLALQLPTMQRPPSDVRPDGTAQPSDLVRAADAAKAQQATRERIAALTREADALKRQSASVLDELRRLDVERNLQQAREAQARQAHALLQVDLVALVARRTALQGTLDRERPLVAARLRRLQRLGRVGYARIAWNAGSARTLGRASRLMQHLARDDGRRLREYQATAAALTETETRITSRQQEARGLEQEARTRRTAADQAYARKQDLLASLEQETGQRERWLAALLDARARLDSTVSALMPVPTPSPVARVPFKTRRRQLPWPVEGPIARGFGRQRDPRFGTVTLSNGLTIRAESGTPVLAVHPGTVVFAGPFSGHGQVVIVDHGAQSYSLYGYLSALRVQRGTAVPAGGLVGEVGDSPDGTPGLYLEVRVDGRPVDPVLWLKRP
jgi:septal ring factor EnvC (AmiA/AmiB activator)